MTTIDRKFVEENKDKRFTIIFENGMELKNVRLFISSIGNIGYMNARQRRNGYTFPQYEPIKEIIDVTKPPKVYDNISNAKTILRRIHPNVWVRFRKELEEIVRGGEIGSDFKHHFTGKLKFRNVSQYLSESQRNELKQAFENKSIFKWHRNTNHSSGRDLSIYTHLTEDGQFTAYFNSEYMGCGNGDYFLLLNPTTAIYYETD